MKENTAEAAGKTTAAAETKSKRVGVCLECGYEWTARSPNLSRPPRCSKCGNKITTAWKDELNAEELREIRELQIKTINENAAGLNPMNTQQQKQSPVLVIGENGIETVSPETAKVIAEAAGGKLSNIQQNKATAGTMKSQNQNNPVLIAGENGIEAVSHETVKTIAEEVRESLSSILPKAAAGTMKSQNPNNPVLIVGENGIEAVRPETVKRIAEGVKEGLSTILQKPTTETNPKKVYVSELGETVPLIEQPTEFTNPEKLTESKPRSYVAWENQNGDIEYGAVVDAETAEALTEEEEKPTIKDIEVLKAAGLLEENETTEENTEEQESESSTGPEENKGGVSLIAVMALGGLITAGFFVYKAVEKHITDEKKKKQSTTAGQLYTEPEPEEKKTEDNTQLTISRKSGLNSITPGIYSTSLI